MVIVHTGYECDFRVGVWGLGQGMYVFYEIKINFKCIVSLTCLNSISNFKVSHCFIVPIFERDFCF